MDSSSYLGVPRNQVADREIFGDDQGSPFYLRSQYSVLPLLTFAPYCAKY